MFKKIVDYFKAPADVPVTMSDEEVKKAYKKGRWDIFSSCFIGYTVFHLTRKNIATALPALESDLGYSNLQLGLLGSALYFAYMFGKFINGVVADKAFLLFNRKYFIRALPCVHLERLCNSRAAVTPCRNGILLGYQRMVPINGLPGNREIIGLLVVK